MIDIIDPQPVLITKNLVKTYSSGRNTVKAVKDVNIEMYRGEVVALMGPSGSGKSTLLNLIGALDKPTSGEVFIDGIPFHALSEAAVTKHRRSKIGFIFQSYNLVPNLSAQENVELPMEFMGIKAAQRKKRAAECMNLAELPLERATHRSSQLSGGEQQRVAIARALANNPAIILADEPTGSLDSETGTQIMLLLQRLAHVEGKTVIIVTHDPNVANFADTVLNIKDGSLQNA